MSFIYVYERAAKIGVKSNRISIDVDSEQLHRFIPIEGVESIIIFGDASISSDCVRQLMERDISLTWLSTSGKFYGRLESTSNVNIHRQRCQFACGNDDTFCLRLAKNIITAKVKNQITILRRYQRNRGVEIVNQSISNVAKTIPLIDHSISREQIMGYEGIAAKNYFEGLSKLVEPGFEFHGRNRQPPKDMFNSLLSFAYTLLLYDIYTASVNRGLNPYASFLHSPQRGHPALCSDLMEEWRTVLADSLALYVTGKGIITPKEFHQPDDIGGVYLDRDGSKAYIAEYEKKIRTQAQYLSYVDYPVSFRRSIDMQCARLARAIEENDADIYQPVVIR